MAYEEKIVGATCGKCGNGKYVRNPKTGKVFCDKKCWLNGSDTKAPVQSENAPQAIFEPNYTILEEKIASLEMALANMRIWAQKVEKRLETQETLTEPLTTEDAKRLHESLAGTSKTIEMAAKALDGTLDDDEELGFQK